MSHISPRRPIEVFPYDIRATDSSSNNPRAIADSLTPRLNPWGLKWLQNSLMGFEYGPMGGECCRIVENRLARLLNGGFLVEINLLPYRPRK